MTQLPPLKKISDAVWEISQSYKEGMNVPARIYATESLLNGMDEGVFNQITNVACLPGIQKYAMCMPDGHWGYGFPIGGVAAFDLDEGVISPGGIGFDINCLVRGSRILTEFGYFSPIENFEENFIDIELNAAPYSLKARKIIDSVISFSGKNKSFQAVSPEFFMKRKHTGKIFHIKTRIGYSVKVTGEHPILTKDGMVEAESIFRAIKNKNGKNYDVAIYPFEGVKYEDMSSVKMLVSEDGFSSQENMHLKSRDLLPLASDNSLLPVIAKLFGYLLGDGQVYVSGKKGFVCAYGKKDDLEEIRKDFARLGFSGKIYSRIRNHKIPTRYGEVNFSSENFELHVSSKALAKLLFGLGYPKGTKTNTEFLVPKWIIESPLWLKRLFLSGLFGAELSKPRTHTKTGFDCPVFSMNKNSNLLGNAREFCIQLISLLEEFGVKNHKLIERDDFVNRFGKTSRLKLAISSKEENLLRLWSGIGYSYNSERKTLSEIAVLYIKEKKFLTEKRKIIADKIKELKRIGLKFTEILKNIKFPCVNERFVRRHYYESAGQRIPLDFVSFEDFVSEKKKEIVENGAFFDGVDSVTEEFYDDFVYDFNIPENHNFVAENIIVSNCGMRLLTTNLTYKDVRPKLKELVNLLFKKVPAGVGCKGFVKLTQSQFKDMMVSGAKWCIENSYGWDEDLERIEEYGTIKLADPSKVSQKAIDRGIGQLGTLGSGNHYLEIQLVKAENVFDEEIAKQFGIISNDQIVAMVHCGSRGFGHQIATDYLKTFLDVMKRENIPIRDKELACAPYRCKEGEEYYSAMACAANSAFANRQVILHRIRECFSEIFKQSPEALEMHMVYDVAHNIAKIEEHKVDGKKKEVIVHRKGSTRSFPPMHPELADIYQKTGQPVIIGGSMETGSYLLVGTEKAMDETFGSTAHGSGRTMSRAQAKREVRGDKLQKDMESRGIYVKAASMSGLAEEAGSAYKNIDEVVHSLVVSGISKPVVSFKPIGNVKG